MSRQVGPRNAVHQLIDRPIVFEDPVALSIVGLDFDPPALVAAVKSSGFTEVDGLSAADLTARLLANRHDGLRLSGLGHVLCARA